MTSSPRSHVLVLLLLTCALSGCEVDDPLAESEDTVTFRVDLLNETAKFDFGGPEDVIFTVEYDVSNPERETFTIQSQILAPGQSQRLDVVRTFTSPGLVSYVAEIPGTPTSAFTVCDWRADRGANDFDTRLVTFTGDKTPAQIAAGEIPTYRLFCFFW